MFEVYHKDDWSIDTLYREWDELEVLDSDTYHSVGGDIMEEEDFRVSVDVHAYRLQVTEEYQLFHQFLVNNNHLNIYRHFRQHVVLLRAARKFTYDPLPFPGVDDDDLDSIHH